VSLLIAHLTVSARADDYTPAPSPGSSVPPASLTLTPETPGQGVPQIEPEGYGAAIDTALSEHAHGNFQEARVHFLTAHRLFPNARTLRGLGNVEFELRNYGEAVNYLTAALRSRIKPLDEELRLETERLLARAKVYVGEIHVDVQPESATVSVDGVTVASGPRASFALVVGDHILEFRALGRMPERRAIRVEGGGRTVIHVQLATPGVAPDAPPPLEAGAQGASSRADRAPLHKRWWLWATIGAVVVAGVTTGLVLGLRPKSETVAEEPAHTTNTPSGVVIKALEAL
jgi:hypothetical protein